MNRLAFGDLEFAWDCGDLPLDPFAPILPLALEPPTAGDGQQRVVISLHAALTTRPLPNPAETGAAPVLFHGTTHCFSDDDGFVLWDGASTIRIAKDGRHLHAIVHETSLARAFPFSSVTVLMALFLALRHFGRFHLHAAGAQWPDGSTWVMPGESSIGKSSLALALFSAGASWLSDDALLLRLVDADIEITGWARRVRMTSQTADAFPSLRPLLTRCQEGSARPWEVDPRAAFPGRGRLVARPPVTLLFPRIGVAADTVVTPLPPAEAFGRVMHACTWVAAEAVPGRRVQLDLLARLVDDARAFDVAVGRKLLTAPSEVVAELRDRLR